MCIRKTDSTCMETELIKTHFNLEIKIITSGNIFSDFNELVKNKVWQY